MKKQAVHQIHVILTCALVAFYLLTHVPSARADMTSAELEIKNAREYRKKFANGESRDFQSLVTQWRGSITPYAYRSAFRSALDELAALRPTVNWTPGGDRLLTEGINEILQGQMIEGNQSLLEAVQVRYPKLDKAPDPGTRLPPPTGNMHSEVLALDRAIEAYAVGFRAALWAYELKDGTNLLRPAGSEYPGFPQFTKLIQPFVTGNQGTGEYPVQVELSLLSRCADRAGYTSVEKAKKLFDISARPKETTARQEAVTELKRGAHQAYILAVALGATQEAQQFQDNGGQKLLVHTRLARQLFEQIQAGLTPFGNSKSFVPNDSITNFISNAKSDLTEARSTEVDARMEQRNYDTDQAALRNELQSQRDQFLSPLKLLTNLDPNTDQDLDKDGRIGERENPGQDIDNDGILGEYEAFDKLTTLRGRSLYRQLVYDHVYQLLQDPYVPGQTTSTVGELGVNVLAVKDAQLAAVEAYNTIQNIPRRIAIEQERVHEVIEITMEGSAAIGALQIAEGIAGGFSTSTGTAGTPPGPFLTFNFNPQASIIGGLRASQTMVKTIQDASVSRADSAATIKNILLEQANACLDLERAKLRYDQEVTNLELKYQKLEQLISDYAETNQTSLDLWFNDPTYQVLLSDTLSRAQQTLDRCVGSLYNLARALEYEWNEEYENPVIIPPDVVGVSGSLGSSLYDPFTQTLDLFGIQSAEEANDFFNALRAWDAKLRKVGTNNISVRGPNRSGTPFTNRAISLRDDVLGLAGDNNNPRSVNDRILLFREYLKSNLVQVPDQAPLPGFVLTYGLNLELPNEPVQPLLPYSNRWNLRVASVLIDTEADAGYAQGPDCTYFLTQAGVISNQTFFDSTRNMEERIITKYSVPGADRPERSVFRAEIPSRINGRQDPYEIYDRGQELTGHDDKTGARPLAATQWQLELDPTQPKNFGCNIMKLRDIKITFKYYHGNPPTFAWGQ